jgi:DNA-binding transcriptional ArsR family regulator
MYFPDPRPLDAMVGSTRRKLLWLLAEHPQPVRELARTIGIAQPTVSKHLRALRAAGLVRHRPDPADGRVHIYELRRDPLPGLLLWLSDLQQNASRAHQQRTARAAVGKKRPRGRPRTKHRPYLDDQG